MSITMSMSMTRLFPTALLFFSYFLLETMCTRRQKLSVSMWVHRNQNREHNFCVRKGHIMHLDTHSVVVYGFKF